MTRNLNKTLIILLSLAFAACTDQKSEPDAEPGSIIGEWVLQRSETYLDGELFESFTPVVTADKMIAVFREDGSYRYYDYPPEEYYEGTYTYDAATQSLSMHTDEADYGSDPSVCKAEISAAKMKWTYPADEDGYATVEYYLRR